MLISVDREYERGTRSETIDSQRSGLPSFQQGGSSQVEEDLDDFLNDVLSDDNDSGPTFSATPAPQSSLFPGTDHIAIASLAATLPDTNRDQSGTDRRGSLQASVALTDDSLYRVTPKRRVMDSLSAAREDVALQTAQQNVRGPRKVTECHAEQGLDEQRNGPSRMATPAMTLAFRPGPSSGAASASTTFRASHSSTLAEPEVPAVNGHGPKRGQERTPEAPSSADEEPSFKRWRRHKLRSQSKRKRARTQCQLDVKPEPEARFRSVHPNCQPLQRCMDPLIGQPSYASGPILVYNDQTFAKDEASPDEVRYIISQCNCDNAETLFNLAKDSFALRFANGQEEDLSEYTWEGELAGRFWQQLNGAVVMCPPRGRKAKKKLRNKEEVVDLTME